MDDLNVIDRFLSAFIRYIDSGFGLLGGDVGFLTSTLIGIDITLAGLFWALGGEQDVVGRFVKKILYVGAFAFIISRFSTLADIVFRSFAAAGLTAGGGGMTADQLLQPGRLAGTGFAAAWPLLEQIADLTGPVAFFTNFVTIAVLFVAWALTIITFFVLAVQVFVTLLEFKLTTLAGFVLVPFALWNRTSFLAERVLGNVVSSGIKVMMLAVIIGISSTFFADFASAAQGDPDIARALSLMLASLTLFGLGIFGPGIASGLVAGAPQLGAGAALGTTMGAVGITALAGGGAIAGARALGGAAIGAVRAGTAMGSAAQASYQLGQQAAGSKSVSAGVGGMKQAATGALRQKASNVFGLGDAARSGRDAAWAGVNGASSSGATSASGGDGAPGWARSLQRRQDHRHHRQVAANTLREGDRGGAAATPDIKEKED
ncbi:P-type conjugative transfer protein TrbL [Hephaestia sp. GCM10023244]|uniref:P-type conjugative transfer protein TrbL n=1 Tax=unclassified Hephaestia TaxID=2631281 RepID=UPI00207708AF|nr:P-type conjugative transfer protein TrbL [Hephaestia sp. MAHUQ-44]MCM8732331.1 P-type conjugative transfer protein TrbL [Hephaestia sp. MAHUQ-44]